MSQERTLISLTFLSFAHRIFSHLSLILTQWEESNTPFSFQRSPYISDSPDHLHFPINEKSKKSCSRRKVLHRIRDTTPTNSWVIIIDEKETQLKRNCCNQVFLQGHVMLDRMPSRIWFFGMQWFLWAAAFLYQHFEVMPFKRNWSLFIQSSISMNRVIRFPNAGSNTAESWCHRLVACSAQSTVLLLLWQRSGDGCEQRCRQWKLQL